MEQTQKLDSVLVETQSLPPDTQTDLNQIQSDVQSVAKETRVVKSDTNLILISSEKQTHRLEILHNNFSNEVQNGLGEIKSGVGLLEEEACAIRLGLAEEGQSRNSEYRNICDLMSMVSKSQKRLENRLGYIDAGPFCERRLPPGGRIDAQALEQDFCRPSRKQSIASQRWKNVYWRWSVYRLPIGMLSIETLHQKSVDSSKPQHGSPEQQFRVTFTFSPPKWIMNSLIRISHSISTQAHSLPYWQRTQCGAMSMVPQELMEYLKEDDLIAIGNLFCNMHIDEFSRFRWAMGEVSRFFCYSLTCKVANFADHH